MTDNQVAVGQRAVPGQHRGLGVLIARVVVGLSSTKTPKQPRGAPSRSPLMMTQAVALWPTKRMIGTVPTRHSIDETHQKDTTRGTRCLNGVMA